MHQNRKGFTLIELLIVVVIIGILAAIAIPKFAKTKDRAYVTAMKSDLKNLSLAEEGFFVDSSKYTSALDTTGLNFKVTSGVGTPDITPGAGFWSATVYHTQYPGHTCAIAINTANPLSTTAGEG
ncbi:MAG TPA: prepilin-type N-terminal cleavage/methylation domain-containing protein, partial [Gemmatimonadaceae bacterium]|nr:prepilin-type N-terminal cleavage/methylation domain-containing protein [Gemmatimonadaceae bacterium]